MIHSDNPYFDSADGSTLDRERADREVEKHGMSRWDEDWRAWALAQAWPIRAQDVLIWLGY